MKVLITGTAGFIGFHLTKKLLSMGFEIVGLDSINDYYDVNLKYSRLENTGILKNEIEYGKLIQSKIHSKYSFVNLKLEDREGINSLFENQKFDAVCNLAAQAGVRYSLTNPHAYIDSNITGFLNILEAGRHTKVKHIVYASSSSVYGLNKKMPFSVHDNVDHPISLYAATKKSNELMAHTYSYLFGIATTGLRFFTVYGPWGRPDMALFMFTKSILNGLPIDVYNHGNMKRDFTFVEDIVEGISRIIQKSPTPNPSWNGNTPDPGTSIAPYKIYNIGNNSPVGLMEYIESLENALGKKAIKNLMPLQAGDVPETWADTTDLVENFDYKPNTSVKDGVKKFVDWYKEFYKV